MIVARVQVVLGLTLALVGASARDQIAEAQPATVQAEQLFRRGKTLMNEGKIAEACDAFEGSYRKDQVTSTLLNLADCREKNGQFASAWGHFLDAERRTRGKADEQTFNATAKARAAKLEGRLSYLIINVNSEAKVDGLSVTRNGVSVDEAEWNTDIPVDGGEYVIEGKAPGFEAWSTKVFVSQSGDKESVNVPKFRARSKAEPELAAVAVKPVAPETPVDVEPARGGSGRKTLGVVSVAGGGALVLGGLAVGYLAQQKWSDAKDLCGDDLVCDSPDDHAAGQELVEAARFRGNVATIVTGVGIAAVGVGVVLWVTAPKGESRRGSLSLAPVVTSDGVGLVLGGVL